MSRRSLRAAQHARRTPSVGATSVAKSRNVAAAPERGAPSTASARRSASPAGATAHSSAHSAALVPTDVLAKLRSAAEATQRVRRVSNGRCPQQEQYGCSVGTHSALRCRSASNSAAIAAAGPCATAAGAGHEK